MVWSHQRKFSLKLSSKNIWFISCRFFKIIKIISVMRRQHRCVIDELLVCPTLPFKIPTSSSFESCIKFYGFTHQRILQKYVSMFMMFCVYCKIFASLRAKLFFLSEFYTTLFGFSTIMERTLKLIFKSRLCSPSATNTLRKYTFTNLSFSVDVKNFYHSYFHFNWESCSIQKCIHCNFNANQIAL